ncbi:MAG: extracellular solute-binding protein [Nocardioidaceae bacterium]
MEAPVSAVDAAEKAAAEAADGKELGGKVTMLGVLGGEELDAFKSVIEPFEKATGVEVQYEGTRDFAAVLQTRVDGGNPPDVVATPAIGEMAGFAEKGDLVNLRAHRRGRRSQRQLLQEPARDRLVGRRRVRHLQLGEPRRTHLVQPELLRRTDRSTELG